MFHDAVRPNSGGFHDRMASRPAADRIFPRFGLRSAGVESGESFQAQRVEALRFGLQPALATGLPTLPTDAPLVQSSPSELPSVTQ
jgi:hypothetical protein